MRVGELGQPGIAGDQPPHPVGHRRRRRDRVDADFLRRVGDGERAGDRGDAAFRRGVAIPARHPHQRNVRAHIDHRPAARLDQLGDAEAAAEKCAVEVELDRPPEFIERGVDRGIVLRGRAAGIVVENVEAAELVDGGADRRLEDVGVGDVGADRDRFVSRR